MKYNKGLQEASEEEEFSGVHAARQSSVMHQMQKFLHERLKDLIWSITQASKCASLWWQGVDKVILTRGRQVINKQVHNSYSPVTAKRISPERFSHFLAP